MPRRNNRPPQPEPVPRRVVSASAGPGPADFDVLAQRAAAVAHNCRQLADKLDDMPAAVRTLRAIGGTLDEQASALRQAGRALGRRGHG